MKLRARVLHFAKCTDSLECAAASVIFADIGAGIDRPCIRGVLSMDPSCVPLLLAAQLFFLAKKNATYDVNETINNTFCSTAAR